MLYQDLLGDLILTKAWGGISKASGKIIHHPYSSNDDAQRAICAIEKIRSQRGYVVCKPLDL
jgi:hypothetical protein